MNRIASGGGGMTRRMGRVATGACVALVGLAGPAWALPPGPLPVTVEPGVRVAIRDVVTLVADVFRPEGDGRYPVLLTRTPYDRHGNIATAAALASHG